MIKAVIFDMFETLITHYESPLYMGKQIANDMGIAEQNFREIWNATDDDRTLGKRSFEDVIEEIIPLFSSLKEKNIKIGLITNCYFEERDVINKSIFFDYFDSICMSCELGIKKPDIEIFKKSMHNLEVIAEECIYVGDGGFFELETAQSLGMHPLQATWYLKDGVNQPAKRKIEFLHAESPLDVISEINRHEKKP